LTGAGFTPPELEVELGPAFGGPLDAALRRRLELAIVREACAELARLDLPARATARVADGHRRALLVRCRGVVLAYRPDLLPAIWAAQAGTLVLKVEPPAEPAAEFPGDYLSRLVATQVADDGELMVQYLTRLVAAIIRERPEALVSPADDDVSRLRAFLLELGVGATGLGRVPALLEIGGQLGDQLVAVAEFAYEELRGHELRLEMPGGYVDAVLADWAGGFDGLCDELARSVFAETGVWIPACKRLEPPGDAEAASLTIGINERTDPPVPLMPQDQVMAPAAVAASVPGVRLALDPVEWLPRAMLPAADVPKLPPDTPILTPAQQLAVLIDARVRRHLPRFMSISHVEASLRELEAGLSPRVAQTARRLLPVWFAPRVLRELVREAISVRDLHNMLERLLEHNTLPLPTSTASGIRASKAADQPVLDEDGRWRSAVDFVRRRVFRAATDRAATSQPIRMMHLPSEVDSFLETAVANPRGNGARADYALDLRRDVWRSVRDDRPFAIVVSEATAGTALRELLGPELPGVRVLTGYDLAPGADLEWTLGDIAPPPARESTNGRFGARE
jgi:hypothetical protein